ncbi:Uncharacterised protein [Mycobacteroides abscessus subsp. abscessus]|nr:Uncharacterised protein [Mycobacteroides abscessus subsp. abscessus]
MILLSPFSTVAKVVSTAPWSVSSPFSLSWSRAPLFAASTALYASSAPTDAALSSDMISVPLVFRSDIALK